MPALSRNQIATRAIQARRPNGGITAPKAAAKSHTTGLGKGQVTPSPGKLGQAKAVSSPAAAAPAAAPSPYTPTPWDSRYEQTVAGAQKSYLNASGNFDLAEQTAKQDFGLDPGFNDYKANPNSRAALLEQTFNQRNRGTMNSAGLQLYSGSTSNRLATNRSAYSGDRDQLAKAYRDALGEITTGRVKAQEDKETAEREAYWDRVGAAEDAPLDAETAPAPGAPKAKAKKKTSDRKKQTQVAVANSRAAPAGKKKR